VSAGLAAPVYEQFAELLRSRSGLVIGPDKLYLLETRLAPIVKREGLRDLTALAQRLRAGGAEPLAREIVEAMTTNESLFFRDGKPFEDFQRRLPRLLEARSFAAPLRIWSAAASTGQEAYSLAMILAEQKALLSGRRVEIIGTDIAREPLTRAREGLYTQFEVQRGLPIRMLVTHFDKEQLGWRVKPALRAAVEFREWNLLSDLRPLGRFDVVFCRNVLIYFDQPTKARVLEAIAAQLAPDGVLYLGGAETVLGLTTRITPAGGQPGIFVPAPRPGLSDGQDPWLDPASAVHSPPAAKEAYKCRPRTVLRSSPETGSARKRRRKR
jgi:chemotaxis protein methyltransferase CheR